MVSLPLLKGLQFDNTNFTLETATFGGKTVTYRLYRDIIYVEKPVDPLYQSLNIKEPVKIDGKAVDCSGAPIFFGIGCAGFLSTTAASGGSFGMPGGAPGELGGSGGPKPQKPSDITSSVEWEAMAGGEGHAGGGIMGIPTLGSFPQKVPGPPPGGDDDGPMAPDGNRTEMLTLGYVVVEVGCRGRENRRPDGTYYGKAPAAIVDLKAAIRYLRYNREQIPGDVERIITTGGSGGGWMSTLVAASGNCAWFDPYLEELGAAKERDDVFASYSTSPIIDHENADGAIEWQGGALITDPVKQKWSQQLTERFGQYLEAAQYQGVQGAGRLTIDTLGDYIVKTYLAPDATRFLQKLNTQERQEYLASRPWIRWDGSNADFNFSDFGTYATRNAEVPSFDDLAMTQPSPDLYGTDTVKTQHFTDFSLQLATGDPQAIVAPELVERVHAVNPTWHIKQRHSDVAPYWWIRHGACDPCLAVAPSVLLAAAVAEAGKEVHLRLVWDGGHCEDDDHDVFLRWVGEITGNM